MPSNLALEKSLRIFGDEKILTVSELSFAIKETVETNFSALKIQGEVSGLKKHSSGHVYLSLKDKESVINAICWRGTHINFQLEDGMEIVVRGKVTTYPARSQYQFIIEEANIAGEGTLLKLLNERRKFFTSLGYFNKNRKLPAFPQIIGIVTSKTGAVLQDMRHRLEARYPFCDVIVWPVNVQGVGSVEQIARAIRGFNFMIDRKPDVLIVARGGGSIEDLWTFNEEIVIKAVFDSQIPVISAIGHETDTTLTDYAADVRAPTPTAAIELTTPVLSEIKIQILDNVIRVCNAMQRIIRELKSKTIGISKCLSSSQFAILKITQNFDSKVERLLSAIDSYVQKESLKLKGKKLVNLKGYFSLKEQKHTAIIKTFDKSVNVYLAHIFDQIVYLSKRLEQSSFKKILEKGFCFLTDRSGKTIETKQDFEQIENRNFSIHFVDGIIEL
ncbi:MAG: exodeoxyribonuclease VII large subunit [Holosporales bacterium]|jgi:exodeoxyribonuclease VII large subunit|nr:exodeoxyribonuclease VII large subunit [Holosporales bacterium]